MGSRVYFGRLARDCRERDIEKLLRNYGEIREIHLRTGYGFVEFRDYRDAEDAIYDLHGRDFLGERLIVEHARSSGSRVTNERPPPPTHTNNRLIVENVASHASWQDLKDFMKKAGDVAFADCHKDRVGEGVVEYYSYEDMKYALERLDDAEFRGHRIRLIEDAVTSRSRSSRRRGRSRSPSRSVSRSPRRRSSRRSPSPRRSASPRRSRAHTSRSVSPRPIKSPRRSPSGSRSPYPRARGNRTPSPGYDRPASGSPMGTERVPVRGGSRSLSPAPRDRSLTPPNDE